MVDVKDWISNAQKSVLDARRAAKGPPTPPVWMRLCRVTDSTLIAGSDKRYLYSVREAIVQPSSSSWVPTLSVNDPVYTALSVSELSNTMSHYSYGIQASNIPAGFSAQSIPVDSWVMCTPHRCTDGTLIMLIVNTQAIDGSCP